MSQIRVSATHILNSGMSYVGGEYRLPQVKHFSPGS